MSQLLIRCLVPFALGLVACSGSGPARSSVPATECQLDQAAENPLHDPKRVASMQVLKRRDRHANVLGDKTVGVAIALKPEKGLTREWLTHVLACDEGRPHEDAATCPVSLPNAETTVGSVRGQLVVYVTYRDADSVAQAAAIAARFHPE